MFKKLFQKDGDFSKTSVILIISYFSVLTKFMITGITLNIGSWSMKFSDKIDASSITAILTASALLYFGVHNITNLKKDKK